MTDAGETEKQEMTDTTKPETGTEKIPELRALIEGEADVKRVMELVPIEDGRFRYMIETPFASFPKFVIGTTDAAFEDVRHEHKCGAEWNALAIWKKCAVAPVRANPAVCYTLSRDENGREDFGITQDDRPSRETLQAEIELLKLEIRNQRECVDACKRIAGDFAEHGYEVTVGAIEDAVSAVKKLQEACQFPKSGVLQ